MLLSTFFLFICITYKNRSTLKEVLYISRNFFNKIESLLLKLCIISILLLIALQIVLNNETLSVFLNKNIEGVPLESINKKNKGIIILKILNSKNYGNVEVLINGETVKKFGNQKEIDIKVYNNDLIEINGTMYKENIEVKVVGVSKNIKTPKLNSSVTTSKSIEILGKVLLK
ncbi:hypothetical protein BET03_01470 [Thermohalobacter berrensis]|uniref:Uncharacterized protein n=1 Tax=Thermohalobacter berrensis TaxID=99594 RepID=A0A419TAK8_9FIRM|nr:hypothetical protein BET03_01470 [Thermohalobacter berrensis]